MIIPTKRGSVATTLSLTALSAALLAGCPSVPPQSTETGNGASTPSSNGSNPQPTPPNANNSPTPYDYSEMLDPSNPTGRMDPVKRRDSIDVLGSYRIMLEGEPLNLKTKSGVLLQVDAYRWKYLSQTPGAKVDPKHVFYPLRAIGEKLGKKVDWNPKYRRVYWNKEQVPQTITLANGLSYVNENVIRQFGNLNAKHYESPGTPSGYAEIFSSQKNPRKPK